MIDHLLIPFQYEYMVKAMLAAAMVGGVCALLSCFVTLRGWSLLGDGLSHAVVPGVAIAYKLQWPFAIGAMIAGMTAAGMMGYLKAVTRIRQDALIGVVYTAYFALGLVLLTKYPSGVQIKSIMFGNILGIADRDLWQMLIVSAVVLVVILAQWKDLLLYCFDPSHARTIGLSTLRLEITLLVLLAATAIAGLQTVGVCLVMAMLITPGACAYLLTDRFGRMMILATVMGSVTAGAGAYASYYLNGSTGGCIVVLQTLVFMVVLLVAPKHGVIAGRLKARKAAAAVLRDADMEAAA